MVLRETTSLQRTYRYLRLAIAGTVVAIFVAVAVASFDAGILPSISAYFYTPARTVFVGALIAASVCLFALSGRGPERALLDAAALMLPLVAIVPTVVAPGAIDGLEVGCPDACVPQTFERDVDQGVLAYLILGALIVVLAAALTAAGQVARAGAWTSIAIAAVVLLIVAATWMLAPEAFRLWAHFVAAVIFFALVAAVALVNAFRPTRERPPEGWLKVSYIAIAIALLLDVAAIPLVGRTHVGDLWGVFVGEVIALTLFLVFWVLQSVQNWNDADPATLR